ncbi:NAD(P)H-dependent glycerol-3-phosphate dehydrogenase [Haloferula sp. A504]|uniref:NAD(P)H-dependent glycerol-3-phosphate dehydrogenase n=1 Tax=Haloferula sp. A504 TaxID=3373601 RepID=UPI0031BBDE48|nr:NAD(P)-dependent glycerol-3-phosphate dehydrogenase [Verrucomicrobiaceae bacterium E54]
MTFQKAAILGAGSLGTSLAKLLAPKLDPVLLVSVEADVVEGINRDHRNPKYLTDIELPHNIRATGDPREALDQPLVIFAVPTSAIRPVAEELAGLGLPATTPLLSCAKGIERNTGERMSEILRDVFAENPIGILTGPNHAEEIAKELITCAVVASEDEALAKSLQDLFTLPHFRTYTTHDVAGIELGGAVKNVYALAAGMAHGIGAGDNAVAALVTRALAEMVRIGTALGGEKETFAGLSGVGDLIVTCFSEHSRNHRVGHAIGSGKTLKEAVDSLGMVAEGVPNTLSIHEAARKAGVRTPILDSVYAVLYEDKPAAEAMRELLQRDPRPEVE